jgi:hypothetical protein
MEAIAVLESASFPFNILSCQTLGIRRRFSSRLLTRSNETEPEFQLGPGISRFKINEKCRATADEDGHYCYAVAL